MLDFRNRAPARHETQFIIPMMAEAAWIREIPSTLKPSRSRLMEHLNRHESDSKHHETPGDYEQLAQLAHESFGSHPFASKLSRDQLEALFPDYLGMSLAFRYLQAAAQKDAIFAAMRDNRGVPEAIELMNAVGNFLSWDESGGIDLMATRGKAGLPRLLDTGISHSDLLRADALELFGRPISPNFSPSTYDYLIKLHSGLSSLDITIRCAHMVAFELHAGAMIEALWTSVCATMDTTPEDLAYFERHVGGDDPAEQYHVEMTQRLIERVIDPSEQDRFLAEFRAAYGLHVQWCRSLVQASSSAREDAPEQDPWHSGSCHCGAVRFEVRAPAVLDVIRCNCSICDMGGFLHLLVPADRFRLLDGEDRLTTYRFNRNVARHTFCRTCGLKPFYRPRSNPDGFSVNVRCLDRSTVQGMSITEFDGQHWEDNVRELIAPASDRDTEPNATAQAGIAPA